jgi:hypothetical protein
MYQVRVFIDIELLITNRRGMAAFMGKDISKLKAKGGGKWKYMSETDMLEISEKFTPYRYVALNQEIVWTNVL